MTASNSVVTVDPDDLGADQLYDLSTWLERAGAERLANRVEIERRNFIAYDDYSVKFTTTELSKMGLALLIYYLTNDISLDVFQEIPDVLANVAEESEADIDREAEIVGFEPIHDEPLDIFEALAGNQQLQQNG